MSEATNLKCERAFHAIADGLAALRLMCEAIDRMLHQVRTLNLADAAADTVAFQVDLAATDASFADYFIPAGVSKRWLKRVRQKIKTGDYWQTGQNLWDSKSGIVTRPLGNLQQRDQEDRKYLMPEVVCGDFCRG